MTDSLPETLVVMPESDDRTLCIEAKGYVRREEHTGKLRKGLERILEHYESYNLLLYYGTDYKGWEAEAAESSMESIIDYGKRARKLAYVNPPEKKIMQMKITADLFSGETRFFSKEDLAAAIAWVKS